MSRIVLSKQLNVSPTASVIFLHGSGDTGNGIKTWITQLLGKELQFPHIRVIFPSAPMLPYTPMAGCLSNVWFDRKDISPTVPECLESINSSGQTLADLIKKEIDSGIPQERIVIGGFSMGGAMAMHLTYRMMPEVAGCFAVSSFLNDSSAVYEVLKLNPSKRYPPLCMLHGDTDSLVPSEWGLITFTNLRKLGVEGSYSIMKNVMHEITKQEILHLISWINDKVPQS